MYLNKNNNKFLKIHFIHFTKNKFVLDVILEYYVFSSSNVKQVFLVFLYPNSFQKFFPLFQKPLIWI